MIRDCRNKLSATNAFPTGLDLQSWTSSPLLWSHRLEIAFLIRIPLPQNGRGWDRFSRLVEGEEEGLSRGRKAPKEESLKSLCHNGHIEHRGRGSEFQIHIFCGFCDLCG